jgi:two-component system alkaline phosphatase synthesis response regulator PhoP
MINFSGIDHMLSSPKVIPFRILFVDRDQDVREAFSSLFRVLGYDIVSLESPVEALVFIRALQPHVIYCSLVFDDLNGFEFCRQLRKLPETKNSLIVAISGLSFAGSQLLANEVGFDFYYLKPGGVEIIIETLNVFSGPFASKILWEKQKLE